jgi:alginate O-acetyltransferase complex protein AlgI
LLAVILAWVPFRAADLPTTERMLHGMAGLNGFAVPAPLVALLPILGRLGRVVPVLPALGDARTLSLPDLLASLAVGWAIVLFLPHLHEMTPRRRAWSVLASGGFTLQALFFSSDAVPFLYFRF